MQEPARTDPVAADRPRCAASAVLVENFGKRDLRSLTRWRWSVMVTGERPTDHSIHPTHRSVLHPLLSRRLHTYAHVVHVLAIYRLPVSLARIATASHEENMLPLRRKTIRARTRYGMHTVRDRNSARLRRDSYARR